MKKYKYYLIVLTALLYGCVGKEDYSLQGDYKDSLLNITGDLMVVYRSFHIANYCATDTANAKRIFQINTLSTTDSIYQLVDYKNVKSNFNPYVFNPENTKGSYRLKYKKPYLANVISYATVNLINLKNNEATYNGTLTFYRLAVNSPYYYIYGDSIEVTVSNKTYYLKFTLNCNENFKANVSKVSGSIETYGTENSKLVIGTNLLTAENDYANNFGLKNNMSYYFLNGDAIYTNGAYSARIMTGNIPNSYGDVPSFNVTDNITRYFSEYPQF